ncbi:diaminopimelate epimerase [Candidatus Hepatobacter penaei]|uniref:diaminopimelate epimerase n=1 Tax=Candidatus Hepatobacter penaei TaxID=1274402 RepID=UPI0004F3D573|nr:diaminopimelate epimerase [Candidatus Hepatobacter penaei]TGW14751.1 diaminopimelate epimerase [bacterium NHP-B]
MSQHMLPFKKMHSLGNDFVIFDEPAHVTPDMIRFLSDRRLGVGCDQVLEVLPSSRDNVHAALRIFNADGTEAEACGNGTRCVMWNLAQTYGTSCVTIESSSGLLTGRVMDHQEVEVTQGMPHLLSDEALPLDDFGCDEGYAVTMGNPHLVVPVTRFSPDNMTRIGPRLEAHPFFPDKTNVEFVRQNPDGTLTLWVWERGTGRTQACASGTCAAVFALKHEGILEHDTVLVHLEGGDLWVTCRPDAPIAHRGSVALVFEGSIQLASNGKPQTHRCSSTG